MQVSESGASDLVLLNGSSESAVLRLRVPPQQVQAQQSSKPKSSPWILTLLALQTLRWVLFPQSSQSPGLEKAVFEVLVHSISTWILSDSLPVSQLRTESNVLFLGWFWFSDVMGYCQCAEVHSVNLHFQKWHWIMWCMGYLEQVSSMCWFFPLT